MCICSNFSLICMENHKNSEIADFLMLIISCLFLYRVGTSRQVLHLFITTITICRKLRKTKYMATRLGWSA